MATISPGCLWNTLPEDCREVEFKNLQVIIVIIMMKMTMMMNINMMIIIMRRRRAKRICNNDKSKELRLTDRVTDRGKV